MHITDISPKFHFLDKKHRINILKPDLPTAVVINLNQDI